MYMKCPNCGFENNNGAKFCFNCGFNSNKEIADQERKVEKK